MAEGWRGPVVRITYGLLAVAAVVIIGAAFYQGVIGTKELSTTILALLGTFLGATFAFRLNQDKEEKKLHETRREALNRALFVLARQANAIHQLRQGYDKFKTLYERGTNLPALRPPVYEDLVHNIVDLEFLLEAGKPTLLFRLAIEQERFHQTIASVQIRNEFYVDEFQAKVSEVGLNGRATTPEEAEKLLGERIFRTLMNTTELAYQHIVSGDKTIPEMHTELLKAARALYPGTKFITFQITTPSVAEAT